MLSLIAAWPALASETTTYTYDALGRLVQVSNAGGPRNGAANATRYDPAGNRGASSIIQALPPPVDNAVFSISGPSPVIEGTAAVFTITKTGPASNTLTVNYATSNGTAVAPGDYTATSGTISFPAFATIQTVSVPTVDDHVAEGAETFTMSLSSPAPGSTIGMSSAPATLNAANQPPVTSPDSGSGTVCTAGPTINVVANDTDPEGNYPLVVVSVISGDPSMDVSVSGSTSVHAHNGSGVTGTMDATYTVRDSLNATSTGTLSVTWTDNGSCQ
jgi:hypothetical protein